MLFTPETFRSKLASFDRFRLAHLPTPLERLPIDIDGRRLFIKRDDCTGFALGGNKARKLEFTLGHARKLGATVLLTASGIQSNHVRQSAAAAAKAGMQFHGVLAPALDQFPIDHLRSGNVLIDTIYGAHLHVVASEADAEAKLQEISAVLEAAGERPFIIPLGASDGVGSLGYANCAIELLDQCRDQGVDVDEILLPTGSGGTHGGLLAGLRASGSGIAVTGVSVSDPAAIKVEKVRGSIEGVRRLFDEQLPTIDDEEIVVHDRFAGNGYAHPTADADAWVVKLARSAGILLDPVYTGKAFSGLMTLAGEGGLQGRGDIIFLHTGGAAALFADPAAIVDAIGESDGLADLISRVT